MKRACILLFTLAAANVVMAQAPGVPIYTEGRGSRPNAALLEQAKKLQGESADDESRRAVETDAL